MRAAASHGMSEFFQDGGDFSDVAVMFVGTKNSDDDIDEDTLYLKDK